MSSNYTHPTVAVGGLGGSGTRAVAELFEKLGFFMGYDINESNDNLLYTLLFKRKDIFLLDDEELEERVELFYKILSSDKELKSKELAYLQELANNGNPQHPSEWLQKRVDLLRTLKRSEHTLWGWKEPNTHLIIEKFLNYSPKLKFIYVYRNGLDMAYSTNQNQLRLFGDIFLNEEHVEITPRNSLKYWCKVHQRMLKLAKRYPENVYLLDFDRLCLDSDAGVKDLLKFMGLFDKIAHKELGDIFQIPSSYKRYEKYSLENFDAQDRACVERIYKSKERE